MFKFHSTIRGSKILSGIGFLSSNILGAGIFGLVGVALCEGGVGASLLGWLIAALIALPLSYVFWKLAYLYPETEGISGYVEQTFGPQISLGIQFLMITTLFAVVPVIAQVGATYVAPGPNGPQFGGAGFLIGSFLLCLVSRKLLGAFSAISLMVLLIFISGIILWQLPSTILLAPKIFSLFPQAPVSNIVRVCALVFFAFMGWENGSYYFRGQNYSSRETRIVFGGTYLVVIGSYLGLAIVLAGSALSGQLGNVPPLRALHPLIQQSPLARVGMFCIGTIVVANTASWMFSTYRLSSRVLVQFFGRSMAGPFHGPYCWIGVILVIGFIYGLLASGILSVTTLVTWVNQNFLLAYGLSVIAYAWRVGTTRARGLAILILIPLAYLFISVGLTGAISVAILFTGYINTLGTAIPRVRLRRHEEYEFATLLRAAR